MSSVTIHRYPYLSGRLQQTETYVIPIQHPSFAIRKMLGRQTNHSKPHTVIFRKVDTKRVVCASLLCMSTAGSLRSIIYRWLVECCLRLGTNLCYRRIELSTWEGAEPSKWFSVDEDHRPHIFLQGWPHHRGLHHKTASTDSAIFKLDT